MEIDDVLFSNLSLEDNGNPPSQATPSSPEVSQTHTVRHHSSSTSSVGAGRTPDSDCPQPSLIPAQLNEVTQSSQSDSIHLPNTLAHGVGDKVLLIGSCNLNGRYGVPIGLNLTSGLTGVFSLASARRIPKWHAWVTHRSVLFSAF